MKKEKKSKESTKTILVVIVILLGIIAWKQVGGSHYIEMAICYLTKPSDEYIIKRLNIRIRGIIK